MQIPKRFKTMGLPFTVEFSDNPDPNRPGILGCTAANQQTIRLRYDMPTETTEQTYLHELLHVAWYQMGLDQALRPIMKEDPEEIVVNALANGLYALIKGGALGPTVR